MSSAYLMLLIFLLAILIPAWPSSTLEFCKMDSAYKLNKQGDNIQPDVLLSQFWTSSNCCFLTCIQVSQETGQVVCYLIIQLNWERNASPWQWPRVCTEFPLLKWVLLDKAEFSTVCCNSHSQRLWHSQSRNRCFSGTLLPFLWSIGCWQFDIE